MKRYLISMIGFSFLLGSVFAATIRVPQDVSFYEAYNAANDGDEIVISPGTYIIYGTYQMQAKKVTLRSTFDGKDWSIVENTILKGWSGSYLNPLIEIGNSGSGSTFRGLRLTFDEMTTPTIRVNRQGITSSGTEATIEYCIIENCVQVNDPGVYGGAISGIRGVIQSNIIRNNRANGNTILYRCGGLIQNNLIYNINGAGVGVDLYYYPTQFINNTVYSSSTAGLGLSTHASVINNVLWHASTGPFGIPYDDQMPPRNCVIKGYAGPGSGIITDDPKFVDPATANFQLQAISPCIDAGLTTATVKADIIGVQRGLKGVPETRGDGSCTDIGAYEYKPKPVAVWLPNGGPNQIRAGETVKVAWEMQNPPAGTAITLKLYQGTSPVAVLGAFWNANGSDESYVTIPRTLAAPNTYTIRGISNLNQTLYSSTPLMTILGAFNAVHGSIWTGYL